MSMSENIQSRVKKRKHELGSEEEVVSMFNASASRLLKQFMQRIDTGEIPIDNVSDYVRLLGAFKEINNMGEAIAGKGGQATLPEINMKQDKVLEDTVQEGKITTDEEGRLDVMDMSEDDVADLIRNMDIAQNKENEGSF
jgi:hypothetical protein